ncbi:calmodulin-like [Physella acuta]|uniref:calmodulin-like n=1 Tax=Physella acuta TaxID=109671 RepID=UPI0027DD5D8F|nr:calmodulin-like [Physella acuta]
MPRKSMAEWEALFKATDKDKNGTLDINELRLMLKSANSNITESQLANMFVYFESTNGDKKITLSEFISGMQKLEGFIKTLSTLFTKFDKDKNGYLDKKELKKIIDACGQKFTDMELDEIMKKMDTSRDGKISLAEFLDAMI